MRKIPLLSLHYGCKVNQYETNAMIQKFKKCGYNVVEFDEIADIYIVNTCTVTNIADRKSRQMLRKVKELNSESILVAVGCYAQVAKAELEKIPEIDLILGTNEKNNIVEYVEKMVEKLQNNKRKNNENCKSDEINNIKKIQSNITDVLYCEEYADFGDVTFTEKTRAVIKVQDGCDRFCSYCIIPFARGHIRSREPKSVISEISKIAKNGIKEVVITGIHLASYGRDFEKKYTNTNNKEKFSNYRLIDLLEEINQIEGIKRIRLRIT